jgi:hypothetical protein
MDLNVIKERLNQMQNAANNQNSGGGKQLFWKPSVGKQTVRIVPFKYNKSNPFTEMQFYYGIGSKKVMASPANWGEKDPIKEFAKQLRQTNDKDNWRLAKKLDAKTRIFAPVVVRGEESEGVKLWQFGKEIYESFLQMAADEEVGDFTDILNGRDIKLNTVGPESTGTPYNRTTASPSMKTSPLSSDEAVVESLLNDQPDPKKVFKPLSYDDMKSNLQEWLSPEDAENEGDIIKEPAVDFDSDVKQPAQSNYSLSTKQVKKSKTEQFDDLFSDDSDDLPF